MRMNRIAQSFSWKYAIGEILLIVIGVTIALAVDSWNTERERRTEEIKVLEQLLASLQNDRAALAEMVDLLTEMADGLKHLRRHLSDRFPYSEDLDTEFGYMTMFAGASISASAYESLKSQGLDLISNDALRVELVSVFETRKSLLDALNGLFRDEVMAFWRGPAVTRFELGLGTATPYDYAALLDDKEFDSLLTQRIALVDGYIAGIFQASIEQVDTLRGDIEEELVRLE